VRFSRYVGIDYSGASTALVRLRNLQVYLAKVGNPEPRQVPAAISPRGSDAWSRKALAGWLVALLDEGEPTIIGIDHAFSFPASYFDRYGIRDWPAFLDDYCCHWPVGPSDPRNSVSRQRGLEGHHRTGEPDEYRLTERWTSSAKSVFRFDVQGQVAMSSHAGIPWLRYLRETCAAPLFFWPFDGWEPPEGVSVITETYPSLYQRRYDRADRTRDEQDAYATARWLLECDQRGILDRYLDPPLTAAERETAEREGWILGIT